MTLPLILPSPLTVFPVINLTPKNMPYDLVTTVIHSGDPRNIINIKHSRYLRCIKHGFDKHLHEYGTWFLD
jgi:hypothetical protein